MWNETLKDENVSRNSYCKILILQTLLSEKLYDYEYISQGVKFP